MTPAALAALKQRLERAIAKSDATYLNWLSVKDARALLALIARVERLERVAEAAKVFIPVYENCEGIITGMTIRCYGENYKGPSFGAELDVLRAAVAALGEEGRND